MLFYDSVSHKMPIMQLLIYNMGFNLADWHVFPYHIPVHPGTCDIAYKQHSHQSVAVWAENHFAVR
jgi:hypothetical protein